MRYNTALARFRDNPVICEEVCLFFIISSLKGGSGAVASYAPLKLKTSSIAYN